MWNSSHFQSSQKYQITYPGLFTNVHTVPQKCPLLKSHFTQLWKVTLQDCTSPHKAAEVKQISFIWNWRKSSYCTAVPIDKCWHSELILLFFMLITILKIEGCLKLSQLIPGSPASSYCPDPHRNLVLIWGSLRWISFLSWPKIHYCIFLSSLIFACCDWCTSAVFKLHTEWTVFTLEFCSFLCLWKSFATQIAT